MFYPSSPQAKDDRVQAPDRDTLIIPSRTGSTAIDIRANLGQLQPHERLLADSGRALTLFGGFTFSLNVIFALATAYPLLLAFLGVAVPLTAHSLKDRLSVPLRLALLGVLLLSTATFVSANYPQTLKTQEFSHEPN